MSFQINYLRCGILIPHRESFKINDLSQGVAQILGRIAQNPYTIGIGGFPRGWETLGSLGPLDPAYFTDENAVGVSSWTATLATIGPSFSVSARAEIHAGSAWKAAHFLSRSASDSQAR
jgi:hypothetical protein